MSGAPHTIEGNHRRRLWIPALAVGTTAVYTLLAAAGDLGARLPLYWTAHVLLSLGMIAVWRSARSHRVHRRLILGAALVFRLAAAFGSPALSDDVYRYVWDGRVQNHGFHPYAFAPDAPELAQLRDPTWERVNHKELRTIYPPAAQAFFAVVAATGAGQCGFRIALGLADFGVVLVLAWLLARSGLPADRVVLYAWNPLAVTETAGSGHVEPLGVALVLLATVWLAAATAPGATAAAPGRRAGRRFRARAGAALALAVQFKLLPLVLLPGALRRGGGRWFAGFLAAGALVALPYAVTGPALGSGLFDYAARWSRNSVIYPLLLAGVERLDTGVRLKPVVAWLQARLGDAAVSWDFLYLHVWPPSVARGLLALAAVAWIGVCVRRQQREPGREALAILGGVLLLSPTLHPWYLLWLLPLAAAYQSGPWLLLAGLVPLAYAGGEGDVPLPLRIAEYAPPLLLAGWLRVRRGTVAERKRR